MKYFKSEAKLQGYMMKHGIISLPRYVYNVAGRFAVHVAMPNKVRSFVFSKSVQEVNLSPTLLLGMYRI